MSKEYITFNDDVFQHKIRKLVKQFGVDEKEFVQEQGALFLNDIGRFVPPYKTFPFGKSRTMGKAQDKKAGQLAINADLKKIFFVPEAAVFTWAEKTFSGKKIYRGKKVIGAGVIKSIDQMRNFHNAHRKPSNGRTRSLRGFQQMWVQPSMYKKYYNMQIADVGTAKASIAKGILRLNPAAKIPSWIRKQISKATGNARMVKVNGSHSAIFSARAYGLQHVSGKSIRIVQAGRLKAMENRLKFIFKNAAKKSGWKVR
jgi:hypothetical protein